jgi:hypothetical protein
MATATPVAMNTHLHRVAPPSVGIEREREREREREGVRGRVELRCGSWWYPEARPNRA